MSAPVTAADSTVLRAWGSALDPTEAQRSHLARCAGTSRWAFNHALAVKVAAHQEWRGRVEDLVATGIDEAAARAQVKVPIPSAFTVKAAWQLLRGDETVGVDGVCPWWRDAGTRLVVARRHHQVAEQRATALHTFTKRLATSWSTVAVEDLNVAGMSRPARGTLSKPGTNVRQKPA